MKGTATERVAIIAMSLLVLVLVSYGLYSLGLFNIITRPTCNAGEGLTATACNVDYDADKDETIVKSAVMTEPSEEGYVYSAVATTKNGKVSKYCYFDAYDTSLPRAKTLGVRPGESMIVTCVFDGKLYEEGSAASFSIEVSKTKKRSSYVKKALIQVVQSVQEGTEPPPLSNIPESGELCNDSIDNDGDGYVDTEDDSCCPDNDGDGYVEDNSYCNSSASWFNGFPDGKAEGDCDDEDASVHPDQPENCNTNKDDNCDGQKNENCNNNCCPPGYTAGFCHPGDFDPKSSCPGICCEGGSNTRGNNFWGGGSNGLR